MIFKIHDSHKSRRDAINRRKGTALEKRLEKGGKDLREVDEGTTCTVCGRALKSKRGMGIHCSRTHGAEVLNREAASGKFKLITCSEGLNFAHALTKNTNFKHGDGPTSFKFKRCKKMFPTTYTHSAHEKKCGENPDSVNSEFKRPDSSESISTAITGLKRHKFRS